MTTPSSSDVVSSSLISNITGLSGKDKRTVVLVAAGGAAWIGCCVAAYITWRNYNKRDSWLNGSNSFGGSKSQKSQFVINELRKVNEEASFIL